MGVDLLFAFFATPPLIPNVKLVLFSSAQEPDANQVQASKQNVWTDLSPKEAGEVVRFLLPKSDLGLTEVSKVTR